MADPANDQRETRLREAVIQALPELDFVLGYARGFDPLHATPISVRRPEDAEKLIFDATCVQNLATGLYGLRGKKIGLVVKGCDSRSVIQLMQEKLLERENVVVFGLPCSGVIDLAKVRTKADVGLVRGVETRGQELVLTLPEGEKILPLKDMLADKCLRCRYPNPLIADRMIGPELPTPEVTDNYADLESFEKLSTQERFDFWKRMMGRCIRCYACRNACPLCVCKHVCLADSREPHWLSSEATLQEKWSFQVMHALHLAGRCTECGECQRSCPMGIPILLLKRKMNRELKEIFNYEAGVDPEAVPPLHTFLMEEDKIKDRGQLW